MILSHPVCLKVGLNPRANPLYSTIPWWIKSMEMDHGPEALEGSARYAGMFARWCDSKGVLRPGTVTEALVANYWAWLGECEYTDSSKHRMFSAARVWFRWLTEGRQIRKNPFDGFDLPKREPVKRRASTPEGLDQLLGWMVERDGFTVARDRAVLALMAVTGMSAREVSDATKTMLVTWSLDQRATAALLAYTQARQEALEADGYDETHYLFVTWGKAWKKRWKKMHPRSISGAAAYWRRKMDAETGKAGEKE